MKRSPTHPRREPPSKKQKHVHFESPNLQVQPKEEGYDNEDLMNLKPEEIAALRNFRKEGVDDMSLLSHLDSAKTRIFEKPIYDDLDEEESGEMERFAVTKDDEDTERDPLRDRQHALAEEREENMEDYWYLQYLESQKNKKDSTNVDIDKTARNLSSKKKDDLDDEEDIGLLGKKEILKRVSDILRDNETISGALRRLSGMPSSGKRRNTRNKSSQIMDTSSKEDSKLLENLTELASLCTARNYFSDVYSVTRESILKAIGSIGKYTKYNIIINYTNTFNNQVNSGNTMIKWEYKAPCGTIFGPFDSSAMVAWIQQGFFPDETLVRKVGTNSFQPIKEVKFE